MRRPLLVLLGGLAATAAVVVALALTWESKADSICREKAPGQESDYSVRWEWAELAYVCDYSGGEVERQRVGIIDAFHGDGTQRHRR